MGENSSSDADQAVVGNPFRGARERLRAADLGGDRGSIEIGGRGNDGDTSQQSVIDRHSTFEGKFETAHDLRIEGNISGEVICRGVLHVAREATARITLQASEVQIHGRLEGDIVCDGKTILAETAVVSGTIKTAALEMHEGSVLNGTVDMGGRGDTAGGERRAARRPDAAAGGRSSQEGSQDATSGQ